ncbi:MAG: putative 5-amino-6-(5-phosphoribosylamino)uracil reductase RibD [Frankiales bacterium]|nr:putative 5-amino-6-(5-phosphoribosylamino)uracil reductase RibD [Frankiales bacterium]
MKLLHPEVREVAYDELPALYDGPGPYLRMDFVASVDGVIAVEGRSRGLSSPADKAVFAALRTVSDAVIVGARTARLEDYGPVRHDPAAAAWRERHGRSAQTPLVVVSRSGAIPIDSRFYAGPVIVAVPPGVEVDGLGEVLPVSSPAELVAALHARGLTRLICEGGPTLLTAWLADGVVDELCLTTSPQLVGTERHLVGSLAAPVDLRLETLLHDEPGVLLTRWAVSSRS